MVWAKNNTIAYDGVSVTDFSSSWKDGLAFCALVSSHFPKELNYDSIRNKSPLERLEIAFEVAGQQGAPPLLDPEDIANLPEPDRRSIITYLAVLYKAFKK